MTENPSAAAFGMPEPSTPADMPARGGNLSAVRGEEAFAETMRVKGADGLVVVKFGASWCTHCAEMLSEFGEASRRHPDAHFVLADVDTLPGDGRTHPLHPDLRLLSQGTKGVDEISKVKPRDLLGPHVAPRFASIEDLVARR